MNLKWQIKLQADNPAKENSKFFQYTQFVKLGITILKMKAFSFYMLTQPNLSTNPIG
jgi:hypothetical protein